MTGVGRRLLGLCLPPLIFCTFDAAITLFGQSTVYWAGSYQCAVEGSPTPNHLLQIHPAAFAMGIVAWEILFVVVILLLPDVLSLIVSIAITFGHTACAATWLWRFPYGYQWSMWLFLSSSVALGVGIYWGWKARPGPEPLLSNWSPIVRWTLIALVFSLAVYLFLWPRTS